MQAIELYNWSPFGYLIIVGILIAAVPFSWVWINAKDSSKPQKLYKLTVLIAFLTFDLIIFGAFTRLTDSGLGCPDWPGCYGSASPFGAQADIANAYLSDPYGPVSWFKAWVEMLHRYFASAIGFLLIILTVLSWRYRHQVKISPWWPIATLGWVILQGAFGAWTVTMKLFPVVVTGHLLLGISLLLLLQYQSIQYKVEYITLQKGVDQHRTLSLGLRYFLLFCLLLVALQVALGGWVSTNYAVLACGAEFPTCSNSLASPWWPQMNFSEGFTLWRELHFTGEGEAISLAALTAIHYTHRLVAYTVIVAAVGLLYLLRHASQLRFWYWALLAVLTLQAATGIATVLFNRPLLFALLHTVGGTLLIFILFTLWCLARKKK